MITKNTIEEKIDSHYMYFTIEGKDKLRFYKGNNKEISRVDLIINNMWNQFILDWTYIMYKNSEWFNNHIGYKFYMFYIYHIFISYMFINTATYLIF